MGQMGKRNMAVLLLAVLLVGVFPEINAIKVHATEATRKKLQEAEDEKKKTEAELGQTKEELENLNEEKNALQGQLNALNGQLQ